jgi:hypothetical protein
MNNKGIVMKSTKLLKVGLPFALLPLAVAVQAKIEPVDISFTTLPEITITQDRAMDFGSVLSLTPSDNCVMTVNAANNVGAALDKSSLAQAGTPGTLTGDCVTTTPGTPGIYFINTIQGSEVEVTLTGSTNADISFAPAGYVVDFDSNDDGGDSTADDVATVIGTGTAVDVYAPTTGEFSATVSPGTIGLVLGGEIINQRALLAEAAVTADFTVDVIYK